MAKSTRHLCKGLYISFARITWLIPGDVTHEGTTYVSADTLKERERYEVKSTHCGCPIVCVWMARLVLRACCTLPP